jgi:hypothetical protein
LAWISCKRCSYTLILSVVNTADFVPAVAHDVWLTVPPFWIVSTDSKFLLHDSGLAGLKEVIGCN